MKHIREKGAELVFLISALASVLVVAMTCISLFANGVPTIREIGIFRLLADEAWKPGNNIYGISPMILGSIYVTAGAIPVSVPIGILTAVFMVRFCSRRLYKAMKPVIDLLAGIPSVVYGFFGLVVIIPAVSNSFGDSGESIATASVLLGIMILPTIIGVSKSAINAIPGSYYGGALALGASYKRSMLFATFPAAKSGILADVILDIGRAIGETTAAVIVVGDQPRMSRGIFQGVRTLTANIVMEVGYATDLHQEALIAIAVTFFVFILLINLPFSALDRRTEQWV